MKKNDLRIAQSYQNLKAAFDILSKFLKEPVVTDRDRAGVIQAFEFCFELFWKTIKKVTESEGLSANSPREAFKAALQLKLIEPEEETEWLQILDDRNLSSHTYHEDLARQIFERIRDSHYKAFHRTLTRLKPV